MEVSVLLIARCAPGAGVNGRLWLEHSPRQP
jgi:hypothetical protein